MATTGLSLQKATQESFRYVTPEAYHYSEALGWVKSPFSQKDWKCILTSALSPDSGSQPGTDSNCYSPTVPGTQVSLTTRPRPTVSIPWAAATKTRVLDGKAGAPDVCTRFSLGDTGALKRCRGRVQEMALTGLCP